MLSGEKPKIALSVRSSVFQKKKEKKHSEFNQRLKQTVDKREEEESAQGCCNKLLLVVVGGDDRTEMANGEKRREKRALGLLTASQ